MVLCQGKDDDYTIKLFLTKLDAELDTLGVTVVDAGGVQTLPDYAAFAGMLVIPRIAILDEDPRAAGPNPKTENARMKLTETATPPDQ